MNNDNKNVENTDNTTVNSSVTPPLSTNSTTSTPNSTPNSVPTKKKVIKRTPNDEFKRRYFDYYDDIKISDRQDW